MPESRSFFVEFLRLTKQFWCSQQKLKIRGTALLLALLTIMQNVMAVLLTQWSADLFDALEQHSMHDLMIQIGMLAILFVSGMCVTGSHLFIKRNLQIAWRDWLTEYVSSRWMKDGHHYLISHLPGEHDNPDGRIAEDCRVVSESAVVLCHSLFYSIMLLISFTEVLWSRSGVVTLDLGFARIPIYGHLVWIAIIYSALASWLGWRVSRPLTGATNARQSAEADFRASLLEVRENSQAIALIHANATERRQFRELFSKIRLVWDAQSRAWRNILMFGSGYSTLNMAFPILIAAPRYILGRITLGTLMQSAQAFQHMVSSLSWPVNNAGAVAEWRASVERILSLLKAIDDVDAELAKPDHWIQVKCSDRPILAFRNLSIAKYNGPVFAENINMEIGKGEHVLITGNAYTGAKLFRAIARIRPWGSGVIELPSQGRLFFMPPRPHLPIGTLRNAICYPSSRRVFNQEQIEQALRLAGLENLIEQLDQKENWVHTLARGEQQLLGMVRLLLNRPQWIFLQEAFDSLAPQEEERMLRLICEKLPDATLLAITHIPNGASFFSRRLQL
ncbi:MAG: ABC transporter ATP-binding protein/permease [Proteobacteria bacterium]|nr:ABC transporter ATP-binding protein/permease [Pseudomonadota bacterium]MBU4296891.1 ABC transporter ATP-binding protein/permease [Pseudomonadota bacterium]MCG2749269.1 ABC transporter ATP-binding protein/permease [Desulfobulbaceae bacterium]